MVEPAPGGRRDMAPATVLHYVQDWLPLSEQFVHSLVTRSRYRPVVVSRCTPSNRDAFPLRPVYSLGRLFPPPRAGSDMERRALTAALGAIALRHRPRIVHNHHGYRVRDTIGLVHRLRVPWVLSLHGHDVLSHLREWPGDFGDAPQRADAIIVPSRWFGDRVVELLDVEPAKVRVIPSGVDTTLFTPTPIPDGSREVLFVGRFVEKKGLDVLLAAWPAVVAAVPEARLRLLGFGPLEGLARSGGPSVEVELGRTSERAAQLRRALQRCRAVVTPSRTAGNGDAETLLLVNLEAQASGRPVVTTRHGGIPEYVDEGRTALIVPEGDADALADALIRVLADDELSARLAAAGPAFAAPLDLSRTAAQVDELYDELRQRATSR
jgi:glycosyltransferase involved in cell wall biosynthesis